MKEPQSIVLVRLPIPAKAALERIAKINRRSLSSQCAMLLESFLPDPLESTDVPKELLETR
jgi:hypothetical protein